MKTSKCLGEKDQMSLDLQGGEGTPPLKTANYDRYRRQQIQKKIAAEEEKAKTFEPGQRVRVNVHSSEPFARKDKYSVWHPRKIFPQGGHITGTVVKPGLRGLVLVELDNPVRYRETIRGKRVTATLYEKQFGYRLLKPLEGEKESQEVA